MDPVVTKVVGMVRKSGGDPATTFKQLTGYDPTLAELKLMDEALNPSPAVPNLMQGFVVQHMKSAKPQAVYDFGNGLVPAARHQNPDGSDGGWVAASASVDPAVTLGYSCEVWGTAIIGPPLTILGQVKIWSDGVSTFIKSY